MSGSFDHVRRRKLEFGSGLMLFLTYVLLSLVGLRCPMGGVPRYNMDCGEGEMVYR